jgi:hypothetical protein
VLKRLSGIGLRRGILGDSEFWFWVGIGAFALRFLNRLSGKGVVYTAELEPGQTLVISDLAPLEAKGAGKSVRLDG